VYGTYNVGYGVRRCAVDMHEFTLVVVEHGRACVV